MTRQVFGNGSMNTLADKRHLETRIDIGDNRSGSEENVENLERLESVEGHGSLFGRVNQNDDDDGDDDDNDDDDDENQSSDIETMSNTASSELESRLQYMSSGSEHVSYFVNTLSHAMDSLDVDKSLAIQAQLSGKLNNEVQKMKSKKEQVLSKLERLNSLYEENFVVKPPNKYSKVGQLQIDIHDIGKRLEKLKNGTHKTLSGIFAGLFRPDRSDLGIASSYPIEYNQAKDRNLER